jgi:hypothetical protein
MKEAFENFINTRENRPAELIAKFVDTTLRVLFPLSFIMDYSLHFAFVVELINTVHSGWQ